MTITVTRNGASASTPSEIRAQIAGDVAAKYPGYTADLPGSLIDDLLGTSAAGVVQAELAAVAVINNLNLATGQEAIARKMGGLLGITPNPQSRTSVVVQFSGVSGYRVPKGFLIGDGTHQYATQDDAVIGSNGKATAHCIATVDGNWAIPVGSVTVIAGSIPSGFTLTCTNPNTGTSGNQAETIGEYRARVFEAYQNPTIGQVGYLKRLLTAVNGVVPRTVSVQPATGGWKILCAGGDPYQVANAIFKAVPDIIGLQQSATTARNSSVSIIDDGDSYQIRWVSPVAQILDITVQYSTDSPNIISQSAIFALVAPAFTSYINSIKVGVALSQIQLKSLFVNALKDYLNGANIVSLSFAYKINSTVTSVTATTEMLPTDPEGYWQIADTGIHITA